MLIINRETTTVKSPLDTKHDEALACLCLPYFDRAVIRSRDDPLTIGTECTAVNSLLMPFPGQMLGAASRIPHPECTVIRSRDDPLTIWAVGTTDYETCMSLQGQTFGATSSIPHLERPVAGSRDDPLTIWAVSTAHYPTS